jgi:molybdate transport system substrate-binding protein
MFLRIAFVFVAMVGLAAASLRAAEIRIAAASDLKFALDDLVKEYQSQHTNSTVRITYGSSGNFFAQLQNRAPFDLYLSADIEYPRRLAAAGLALDTNAFLYAVGRIVVWSATNSPVDAKQLGIRALLDPAVKKIAIANPQHAPYGRAAVAAMKSFEVYRQAQPKLVLGENIAQTAQFIQSGAAEVGIVALSLAVSPQMRDAGHYWEVPLDAYPEMQQGGIILKWTKHPDLARSFRDFVLGEHGRAVLTRYGFSLPEK